MKKKNKKAKFFIYLFFLIFLYFSYSAVKFPHQALDSEKSEKVNFVIKKGSSLTSVANQLEEEKLISNSLFFKIWSNYQLGEKQIQSGTYQLSAQNTPAEILETITNPNKRVSLSFTIPEGYTIKQIDKKLAENGLITEGEFLECIQKTCSRKNYTEIPQSGSLEGYIFPDTYFLNPQNFTPQVLLDKSLDNFHTKWTSISHPSSKYSTKEIITVASMIEKEVKTDPDRPIVSGIIWKRLEDGWTLGIDATTIYETENNSISAADLKKDSPYNTRLNRGLPPTAISNPGLKSIEAAINPKYTSYRFYITEPGSGRVIYAQTNDEQNRNRAKYLK